jgi:hypothetical protein
VVRNPDGERPTGEPRLRDYATLAAFLLGGLGCLLVAPLFGTADELVAKSFGRPIELVTMGYALQVLAGAPSAWVSAVAALGLVVGVGVGYARDRLMTVVLVVAIGSQLVAILFVHPSWTFAPWILARYNVWVIPFLLLLCSRSVCLGERLPGRTGRFAPAGIGIACCAALYFGGPIPGVFDSAGSFSNHARLGRLYSSEKDSPRLPVPDFYRRLAAEPGDFEIVEAPWYWARPRPYYEYQRIHGKPVLVGQVGKLVKRRPRQDLPLRNPKLDFSRYVDVSDLSALAARRVRYVILHRDSKIEMAPVIRHYRRNVGPAVYQDEKLVVFRLGDTEVDGSAIR